MKQFVKPGVIVSSIVLMETSGWETPDNAEVFTLFNFLIGQVDQFGDDDESDGAPSFSSFIHFFHW